MDKSRLLCYYSIIFPPPKRKAEKTTSALRKKANCANIQQELYQLNLLYPLFSPNSPRSISKIILFNIWENQHMSHTVFSKCFLEWMDTWMNSQSEADPGHLLSPRSLEGQIHCPPTSHSNIYVITWTGGLKTDSRPNFRSLKQKYLSGFGLVFSKSSPGDFYEYNHLYPQGSVSIK